MKLPYHACISCVKRSDCPILTPGVMGKLRVPKPTACILDQLQPADLASIATQIESNLGILEVQRESYGRQLEMILNFMSDLEKKVIV